MNDIEAMQMARVDGIDDGYRRAIADAISAIRVGRDDWESGEDIGKLINSILSVAEDRIRDLLDKDIPTHPLAELLHEVRDSGLIYWEPQTTRGAMAKADMIARIDAALSPVSRPHQPGPAK